MLRIELTIPGKPVAQGRPRFYRRGNFVVATDPKASKVYKADIQYLAQKHKENNNISELLDGPLGLDVMAYFPCPKSRWRKTKPRTEEHHAKRPDADNVAKSIKDGLTGVFYHEAFKAIEFHSLVKSPFDSIHLVEFKGKICKNEPISELQGKALSEDCFKNNA